MAKPRSKLTSFDIAISPHVSIIRSYNVGGRGLVLSISFVWPCCCEEAQICCSGDIGQYQMYADHWSFDIIEDYDYQRTGVQEIIYSLTLWVKFPNFSIPPIINMDENSNTVSDALQLRHKYKYFRILVIGRANAGKTTLLKRVCNTNEELCIYDENGENLVCCLLFTEEFISSCR